MRFSLNEAKFSTQVISPVFRSERQAEPYLWSIDLRFLRVLNPARLPTKILAWVLFTVSAFVRFLPMRKEVLAVQYESIFSLPAAFLLKLFCRCPCIGDDVLISKSSGRLPFVELAIVSVTDLLLSSTSSPYEGWLAKPHVLRVPNGVTEKFVFQEKSLKFETIRVIFVGAMSYRANLLAVNHIINSSELLPQNGFEFKVVGGPIEPWFFSRGIVKFLGPIDDDSLRDAYREANVGLLPFFGIRAEGPKLKLLEYMAAGLLVVSSPEGVQGYPELVAWKHYVPASSEKELVDVLREIRSRPELFVKIAEEGHEFAMTHYRWPVVLGKYVDFLRTLENQP